MNTRMLLSNRKKDMVCRILLFLVLMMIAPTVQGQRVKWYLGGSTEGLWNMKNGEVGWQNLLDVVFQCGLWRGANLEMQSYSTYHLNTPVMDDYQGFSFLDAGPSKAFRLVQAGISQELGERFMVFAGLRNIDLDFFNTPYCYAFSNASFAGIPILWSNFSIGTYPTAALCLHGEYRSSNGFIVKESVYNGTASDRLDEQFRVCPKHDGVFNVGSVTYFLGDDEETHDGLYTLGYGLGNGPSEENMEHDFNYAMWGIVEQPFLTLGQTRLGALLQGAFSPKNSSYCHAYWSAGLVLDGVTSKEGQLGLALNRALFADGRETVLELSGTFPLCDYVYLQPSVQCINTSGEYAAAAILRATVEIGNF